MSDEELEEICRSQDRPEKERLILRKRHQYPTHEEFKRKGTITQKRNHIQRMYDDTTVPWTPNMGSSSSPMNTYPVQTMHQGLPDRQQTVDIITSVGSGIAKSSPGSNRTPANESSSYFSADRQPASTETWDPRAPTSPRSGTSASSRFSVASYSSSHAAYRSHTPKLRQFFGERPPSEIISSNLPSFFPNHKPEILETAGFNAKRLSMRRGSNSSGSTTRHHRDSVMPELASVLGLELDKVFEQEELEAQQDEWDHDYEEEEEDEFRPPAELKLPTSPTQKTSLQNKRFSTLLTVKADGDVKSHMPARKSSLIGTDTTLADKGAQLSKVADLTSDDSSENEINESTTLDMATVPEVTVEEPAIVGK